MTIPFAPPLEITGLAALFVLFFLVRRVSQGLLDIGRALRVGCGVGAH